MAKKLVTKAQNKEVGITLMDHVLANLDIEAAVVANAPALQKVLNKKIKEVLENYDWSNLLYDALDSRAIGDQIRARVNSVMSTALFGSLPIVSR